MRAFATAELLEQWEAGLAQPGWVWSRQLLCAAYPELGADRVDAFTVGERDARLLALRESWFGTDLLCRSDCPACGAPVEMTLTTASLLAGRPPERAVAGAARPEMQRLAEGEWDVSFRLPTMSDVGAAAEAADVAAMRAVLLRRCVLAAERGGVAVAVQDLPESTIGRVMETIAAADPHADIHLRMQCPGCSHEWADVFDIVSYLWAELETWAGRLLNDVHRLASAYGWTEAEVLALSPQRRARYLEMIGE